MSVDSTRPVYERGTGFLLARLGSLTARSWTAFLNEHHLTQGQYTLMVALKQHEPASQRRLAELVAMDARNIVLILDSLAAANLIERRPDDTDRRRRIITLTEEGNNLLIMVADAAAAEQDHFLHALSGAERKRLNHLLQRLYDSHVPAADPQPG
ncbi:MarR family winged helix-turn-helix transcriptional regulator [Nonomuraea aurantiaca]|uniref:MarR family winged helix-turn-helix transcriptional regulator n=1 Tax=Nonomuraea aurantiaca TaxID=2878562 RepID=UPI001CDA3674|nr:MarR family winged helix-turn-helix transcriptional regulator [Nonomuraea aurantiaca]MCA2230114.1 MarR family winged helix-turn-helix transcriptional regulator [Nonomuraea aurantiaca]